MVILIHAVRAAMPRPTGIGSSGSIVFKSGIEIKCWRRSQRKQAVYQRANPQKAHPSYLHVHPIGPHLPTPSVKMSTVWSLRSWKDGSEGLPVIISAITAEAFLNGC